MCGRFTLTLSLNDIQERFSIQATTITDYQPDYNVSPGTAIAAIISDGTKNRLGTLKWGLVPFWADDPKIGYKMINARSETAPTKNSFKRPLQQQRCIIPADSFYEWTTEKGKKQPYRIYLKDQKAFGLAGLWEKWEGDRDTLYTCTILTTAANTFMKKLHDRMPIILTQERESLWLDPSIQDTDTIQACMTAVDGDRMTAYPVSTDVNSPNNQGATLIEPIY
ncbi:SOS response-associated peptidase [Salibacterium aidingense]|uniref:SOS response-associated peptidase n=1 Tax=Salibacterium aidingense TaxID=384933 RepID=UPI000422AA1D|nr:SOS response-associated peptidase [Salibacterium aidingense]